MHSVGITQNLIPARVYLYSGIVNRPRASLGAFPHSHFASWNGERQTWSLTAGLGSLLILCSVFRSRAQPSPSLPPLCPACLPISHPWRARVCMYIPIIAPSSPHPDVPVVPAPPLPPPPSPACSQSCHGTISHLPGPRGGRDGTGRDGCVPCCLQPPSPLTVEAPSRADAPTTDPVPLGPSPSTFHRQLRVNFSPFIVSVY